jgi:hypothetical protein
MKFRGKLHEIQKYSKTKLLESFRTAINIERWDSKYKIGATSGMTNTSRLSFGQTAQIETEIRRNTAVLYAHMVPPR